jgi:hypothetical protein
MTVESGGTSPVLIMGAIVGLVGLAMLVLVMTLAYLRGQEGKRKRDRVGKLPAAGADPVQQQQEPSASAPGLTALQGEVMRVYRDPESARVLVEVEGRRYERLREIEDAQVGRRVLWTIADLVRFTGGMATNPRAVRSASQGVAWEGEASGAGPDRITRRSTSPAVRSGNAASPSADLTQTMRAFFQRGLSPAPTDAAPAEPVPFIEQIDEILQAKMLEMDVPPSYELHVSAGPGQRLQIQVGREFYSSIDDVPNLQAQSLIRAAVDEWESR